MCKLATHSRKSIDGTTQTVAAKLVELYGSFDTLLDAAKPRTLSPALAAVRKSVDGLSWQSAKFCAQAKAIPPALSKVAIAKRW